MHQLRNILGQGICYNGVLTFPVSALCAEQPEEKRTYPEDFPLHTHLTMHGAASPFSGASLLGHALAHEGAGGPNQGLAM